MKRSILIMGLFLMVFGFMIGISTAADTYPSRPVQFIIPGTPGSIIDITGRLLAGLSGKGSRQPFIPVNKPGGGFTVGTDIASKSKKDGYTLLYTNNPAIIYARVLNPESVGYDPDKISSPGLHLFFAHNLACQTSSPWEDL